MPTVNNKQRSSFWDLVGVKQDISEMITMLSPHDTPLLSAIGPTRDSVTQTKHQWLEEELVPTQTTLAADASGNSATVVVATGTGAYFLADDIVKVGSEVMFVSSVSTDTLTVVRGFGSSSPAAHTTGATLDLIGNARKEGADAGDGRTVEKTIDYNYTQIFDAAIKVSGTREAISQYGIESDYAHELSKKVLERAIAVEKALIHGVRTEDTTNERRTMGGLLEFCDQNTVDALGAKVTESVLNDLLADIWRKGGSPRLLAMNIDQKDNIASLYADRMRTDRSDHGVGGYISYIENSLGRFDILLDRWVPRDSILVLDRTRVGIGPLRGRNWSHTLMGKKGDYVHGQMLAELTCEVRGRNAHGLIKNLAL